MDDMDFARRQGVINVDYVQYAGHAGYKINPADYKINDMDFISKYKADIFELINLFGDKNAKDLGLLSTIIYLYNNFRVNLWECNADEISEAVHKIKPHFQIDVIKREYIELEEKCILSKVA